MATSGGQTAQYLYGLELLGVQQGGQGYSPLADALGSLRQWTDAAGAVVGSASYDPFGGVLSQQGFTSPWGFAGEYHDPLTGLQYLRARWYQPGVGRFTQGDPFPGVLALPLTQNPYVYGLNNPTRYTDPSGKVAVEISLAGGTLSAVGEIIAESVNFAQLHPGITWEQFLGCLGKGAVLNGGMIVGAFVSGFTSTLLYELVGLVIIANATTLGVGGLLGLGFITGAITSVIGDFAGRNVELFINGDLPAKKSLWDFETYRIDIGTGGFFGAVGMAAKVLGQTMKTRTAAYQAEQNYLRANAPTWRGTSAIAMNLAQQHDLFTHSSIAQRHTIWGFSYAFSKASLAMEKYQGYVTVIDKVSVWVNSNWWYSLYDAYQP